MSPITFPDYTKILAKFFIKLVCNFLFNQYFSKKIYFLVVSLLSKSTPHTPPIDANIVESHISRTDSSRDKEYHDKHPDSAVIQSGGSASQNQPKTSQEKELDLKHFSDVQFETDSEPVSEVSSVSISSDQEEEIEQAFLQSTAKIQQLTPGTNYR